MEGEASIAVDYDESAKQIVATFDGARVTRTDYVGRLDRVRELRTEDLLANVAVHESGHAVVYAVRFGLAPLQLTAKVASTEMGGFTFPHDIHQCRESMLAQIQVFVAGGVAEEIVFGEDGVTGGAGGGSRRSDLAVATAWAFRMITQYGLGKDRNLRWSDAPQGAQLQQADELLRDAYVTVLTKLRQHEDHLQEMADTLADRQELRGDDIRGMLAVLWNQGTRPKMIASESAPGRKRPATI